MILILGIIILLSYREVGILCERGSWNFNSFQRIYWDTDQNNFWLKNLDWFHVSNGLMTLLVCILFAQNYSVFGQVWIDAPFYWVCWMYIRNVFMHVIIPLPWDRKWFYLIPLIGGWLDRKYALTLDSIYNILGRLLKFKRKSNGKK